jgi:hypothetical protein
MGSRRCALGLGAALLSVIVATPLLFAFDDEDDKTGAPTAADLKFMTGTWSGTIFGGPIVETWGKPEGGVMIGMSRMGGDAARAMYEFMMIDEKDGAPTMFLRHFRRHLATGESEPMAFRLTSVEGETAVFECPDKKHSFTKITYTRSSKNELHVTLEGERECRPSKVESRMKRAKGR